MPNPHPITRTRKAPSGAELLPPGFDRWRDGALRYRFTDELGRRRAVYGRTVDECNRKRFAPITRPRMILPTATLTGAYLETWAAGLSGRPNTNRTHTDHVHRYLIPMFGAVPLSELASPAGRELIRAAFAELRATPIRGGRLPAPRTIALVFATLRRALNAAVEDGRIAANPAARLNILGTTGAQARSARVGVELRIPSDEELRRVLHELDGTDAALFQLAVLTGLRQSEELGLGWDAFAVEGYVRVTRALRRSDRVLDDPKSRTSARFVPLPPAFAPTLRSIRTAQAVARLAAGKGWHNPHELVFTDATGAALVGSSLSHRLTAACRRAGVEPFRWHDLRHAYASGSINRGVSIALVSKYLGHANVAITSEVYHHVAIGGDDSAVIAAATAILG